jgi:hypothetical protein
MMRETMIWPLYTIYFESLNKLRNDEPGAQTGPAKIQHTLHACALDAAAAIFCHRLSSIHH